MIPTRRYLACKTYDEFLILRMMDKDVIRDILSRLDSDPPTGWEEKYDRDTEEFAMERGLN